MAIGWGGVYEKPSMAHWKARQAISMRRWAEEESLRVMSQQATHQADTDVPKPTP